MSRPPALNKDVKKNGRKGPGDAKRSSTTKSPGVKRSKEITYIKLFAVQQQYKWQEPKVQDIAEEDDGKEIKIDRHEDDEPEAQAEEEMPAEGEE